MPKLSAGILLYRTGARTEVFLVHPGGPFWAKKDAGAWSIPKGEYTVGDDPQQAAKREFTEETGFPAPSGNYTELGEVKYGNKQVTAWAVEGDAPANQVKSNLFSMEWPPKSSSRQQFPEVDRAGWFSLNMAKEKLVSGQVAFIDRLQENVAGVKGDPSQTTLF